MTEYEEMLVAAGMISEADCDIEYQEYLRTWSPRVYGWKRPYETGMGSEIIKKPLDYSEWLEQQRIVQEIYVQGIYHDVFRYGLDWAEDAYQFALLRKHGTIK